MTSKHEEKPSQDDQPPPAQSADAKPKKDEEAKKEEYSVIGNFTVGKPSSVDKLRQARPRERVHSAKSSKALTSPLAKR